jgi:hypothetical protein
MYNRIPRKVVNDIVLLKIGLNCNKIIQILICKLKMVTKTKPLPFSSWGIIIQIWENPMNERKD